MTFYRSFPDKISVAKAVFEAEIERGMTRFREILQEQSSPEVTIKKILAMKSESTTNISREFLQDFLCERINRVARLCAGGDIKDV